MSLAVLNEFQNNPLAYRNIKIIALGDIAFDRTFLCRTPRFAHATHGTETLVEVEEDDAGSVGSVNCTAQFCVSMGADSLLISIIGQDREGKLVREILAKKEIRHTLLEFEEIQTVTKLRFFTFDKNRGGYILSFRADKETYEKLDVSYAKSEEHFQQPEFQTWLIDELTSSDGLVLNDTEKGFLSAPVLQSIAEMVHIANERRRQSQQKPIVIIADPKRDWQKFQGLPADYLTPNEEEALYQVQMSGTDVGDDKNLLLLAERLYQQYSHSFPKMLLTLGRHGGVLLEADEGGAKIWRYPAVSILPSQYHVATHCGDMFDAAIALTLATGADIHSAITFANYVGSLQFSKLTGTKVTREDILMPQNIIYLQTQYRPHRLIGSILDEKKRIALVPPPSAPQSRNAGAPQIFLSYCHTDIHIMQKIQQALLTRGFTVWTDEHLVPGTPSWKEAIETAIHDACAVLAILSPDAKRSRWVNEELSYAETQNTYIIPLLCKGKKADAVPFGLTTMQFLDMREDRYFDAGITKLSTTVQKLVNRAKQMP